MLRVLLALALILLQDAPPRIAAPQAGETLRGQINILGNINVTNFSSAELAFAYAPDATSTWFAIQTFSEPILDSTLAVWDTTALTDGDYSLRLKVYLTDGSFQEILITDLHIRNDVPISTDTPVVEPSSTPAPALPTAPISTSLGAGSVPAAVLPTYPTPTPLPANPATLTTPSIYSNFARGTIATLVLFFLIGLFLRLRRS